MPYRFAKKPPPVAAHGYRYHIPKNSSYSGWRFYAVIGGMIGCMAMMLYPIVVDPVLHIDKYKKAHEAAQTELFQSGLLPGQLKKWEDPFKRKSD